MTISILLTQAKLIGMESSVVSVAPFARLFPLLKAYFVEHGVNADRIHAEGIQKSFKYTNRTGDGRWMNRRVELIFEDVLTPPDLVEDKAAPSRDFGQKSGFHQPRTPMEQFS